METKEYLVKTSFWNTCLLINFLVVSKKAIKEEVKRKIIFIFMYRSSPNPRFSNILYIDNMVKNRGIRAFSAKDSPISLLYV